MDTIIIFAIVSAVVAFWVGYSNGNRKGFRLGVVTGWQALNRKEPGYVPDDVVLFVASRAGCHGEKWYAEMWNWLRDSGRFTVFAPEGRKWYVRRNEGGSSDG